jgi:hypothetical protein
MPQNKIDITGIILLSSFFLLLLFAGYLSYKSIDWNVLKRLESQQLVLPTPIPTQTILISPAASPSATIKL